MAEGPNDGERQVGLSSHQWIAAEDSAQADPIARWRARKSGSSSVSIANDGSERRIAPKALDKFRVRVRELTRRTRGESLPQVVEGLRPYLIGWRNNFGFCQTPRVLTNLEARIRRPLAGRRFCSFSSASNASGSRPASGLLGQFTLWELIR